MNAPVSAPPDQFQSAALTYARSGFPSFRTAQPIALIGASMDERVTITSIDPDWPESLGGGDRLQPLPQHGLVPGKGPAAAYAWMARDEQGRGTR